MSTRESVLRRLCENLDALRHLPPHTVLPRPFRVEERQTLETLLQLPKTVDPILWLQRERSELSARLTLHWALERIINAADSVWQARGVVAHVSEKQASYLGDLVHLATDAEPFTLLTADAAGDREQLKAILARLRILSHLPYVEQAPSVELTVEEQLLVDLMRLPVTADVLDWLRTERSLLTAEVAFRRILEQGLPDPLLGTGNVMNVVQVAGSWRTDRLQIAIHEVIFGTDGFAVRTRVQIAVRHAPSSKSRQRPVWMGFDRVVDDQGYRYLIRGHRMNMSSSHGNDPLPIAFHPAVFEHGEFAFYPAVATGSRELTFTASATELAVIGSKRLEIETLLPDDLTITPYTWRITVA